MTHILPPSRASRTRATLLFGRSDLLASGRFPDPYVSPFSQSQFKSPSEPSLDEFS